MLISHVELLKGRRGGLSFVPLLLSLRHLNICILSKLLPVAASTLKYSRFFHCFLSKYGLSSFICFTSLALSSSLDLPRDQQSVQRYLDSPYESYGIFIHYTELLCGPPLKHYPVPSFISFLDKRR